MRTVLSGLWIPARFTAGAGMTRRGAASDSPLEKGG